MAHFRRVFERIERQKKEMVEAVKNCVRKKAIGPLNGGDGEAEKAEYLENLIKGLGFKDVDRIEIPDGSVPAGHRPNIIARVKGKRDRTLWFIGHMDVVPAGDESKWNTDPFEPVVKDGRIYGRGSEDNAQDLVGSIFALKAIMEEGVTPEYNLAVMCAADEETGSGFGVKAILDKHPKLFSKKDLVMVPDAGTPRGELIEIAEKSILWLKVRTTGQQCHGSTPQKGINAHMAGAKYTCQVVDNLYSKFSKKDNLFMPPISTFEVTKKETNVPSINIIPGDDVVYFDNRILPDYPPEMIMETYQEVAQEIESEKGVRFNIEVVQRDDAAPPTKASDDISRLTRKCVRKVYGNNPFFGGIGGGTYAAMFRRVGIPAVVWGKGDELAHQPNEYCVISHLVGDAKVFAAMALTDVEKL